MTTRDTHPTLALLTIKEVATLLQVHPDWVYDQVNEGKMPATRLGRNIRFRPADLDAYLAGTWSPET